MLQQRLLVAWKKSTFIMINWAGIPRPLDHMPDAAIHANLVVSVKEIEIPQEPSSSTTGSCSHANVNQFTCLASVLYDFFDVIDNIRRLIPLASAAFGRQSTRGLLNKNLNTGTRVAVCIAVGVSTVVYVFFCFFLFAISILHSRESDVSLCFGR